MTIICPKAIILCCENSHNYTVQTFPDQDCTGHCLGVQQRPKLPCGALTLMGETLTSDLKSNHGYKPRCHLKRRNEASQS